MTEMLTGFMVLVVGIFGGIYLLQLAVQWALNVRWRLIEYEITRQRFADYRREWEALKCEFQKIRNEATEARRHAEAWEAQYYWASKELEKKRKGAPN